MRRPIAASSSQSPSRSCLRALLNGAKSILGSNLLRLHRDLQRAHEARIADIPSDKRGQLDNLLRGKELPGHGKGRIVDVATARRLFNIAKRSTLLSVKQWR